MYNANIRIFTYPDTIGRVNKIFYPADTVPPKLAERVPHQIRRVPKWPISPYRLQNISYLCNR